MDWRIRSKQQIAAAAVTRLEASNQLPLARLQGLNAFDVGCNQQPAFLPEQFEQIVLRRGEFVQQRRDIGFPILVFHQDQRCWSENSSNIGPVN